MTFIKSAKNMRFNGFKDRSRAGAHRTRSRNSTVNTIMHAVSRTYHDEFCGSWKKRGGRPWLRQLWLCGWAVKEQSSVPYGSEREGDLTMFCWFWVWNIGSVCTMNAVVDTKITIIMKTVMYFANLSSQAHSTLVSHRLCQGFVTGQSCGEVDGAKDSEGGGEGAPQQRPQGEVRPLQGRVGLSLGWHTYLEYPGSSSVFQTTCRHRPSRLTSAKLRASDFASISSPMSRCSCISSSESCSSDSRDSTLPVGSGSTSHAAAPGSRA